MQRPGKKQKWDLLQKRRRHRGYTGAQTAHNEEAPHLCVLPHPPTEATAWKKEATGTAPW